MTSKINFSIDDELNLNDLEECFADAKKRAMPFIGIKIKLPDCKKGEVIIDPYENFDSKIKYYKKAYNENLTLKTCSDIKIINFAWGIDYADIEKKLF